MSYLVTVTFELKTERSGNYQGLDQALSALGLSRKITGSSGKTHDLPSNVYAGAFEGENVASVRTDVAERVESAFQRTGTKATIFIAVGRNWSWALRYT